MESKTTSIEQLSWFELNTFCTQTEEAALEVQRVIDGFSAQSVEAVINASYVEGKTFSVFKVVPAHHIVVQAILNMSPSAIKKIYNIVSNIPEHSCIKLSEVVTKKLNPQLLQLTVADFRITVELLYFLKEYLLSLFGMGLVNIMCKDKIDVVLILSQVTMSCNLCDRSASSVTLYQCLECSVSSVCVECLQTQKGAAYLAAHSVSCRNIQNLLQPYVDSMRYAHLCKKCFVPLHRNVMKNHFQPEVLVSKKRDVICGRAKCTVKKCKRDLCHDCLFKTKK